MNVAIKHLVRGTIAFLVIGMLAAAPASAQVSFGLGLSVNIGPVSFTVVP